MRVFVAVVLCLLCGPPALAAAPQFWLAGRDPVQQRAAHKMVPPDFMALFQSESPWQHGAARLAVFKIFPLLVLRGPDDLLRTIFQGLRARHFAIAIELGTLLDDGATCGGGEGFTKPGTMDRIGRRLQSLGLALDYVAMDEPLWFGHERYWGHTKLGLSDCRYPVPLVAERTAASLKTLRGYFPALKFGDIEPVGTRIDASQLVADYTRFAQLLEKATGQGMAFFHADIAWQDDWQPLVAPLERQMHALGIRFGVIAGGSAEDPDDQEWVDNGLRRLRILAGSPATRPDDIIIQSWQLLPDRMLPETMPGTTTYMLDQAESLFP